MERLCVFCGGKLESKTVEHVLPQWLIELTGNPKRIADFGYYRDLEKEGLVKRKFAFNAFKFPSCKECNQRFASLEASAKVIVEKMISEDPLSESDLNVLLDWFDKVRIGLWLGFLYLDKNPLGVSPHFHIQHRIRQHDRMIAVFKADGNRRGLNITGCDTVAFSQAPSCFCLRINSLFFLNMSYPNLLARRMGFPFPMKTYYMEDERLACSFVRGRNRITRPVLKRPIGIKGTELYQTIFYGNIVAEGGGKGKSLYDTKYVRDNCMVWEEGIGKIYIKKDSEVAACDSSPSMEWLPERTHDFEELILDVQLLTFEWQSYMLEKIRESSMELLSDEKRRQLVSITSVSKYENREMLKLLIKAKRHGI